MERRVCGRSQCRHRLTVDGFSVRTHYEEVGKLVNAGGYGLGAIIRIARKRVVQTGPLPALSRIGVSFAVRRISSVGVSLSRDRLLRLRKMVVATCIGTAKRSGTNESGKAHQAT